jgi:hypothetical protein
MNNMNDNEIICGVCNKAGACKDHRLPEGWSYAGHEKMPDTVTCSKECHNLANEMHKEKVAASRR